MSNINNKSFLEVVGEFKKNIDDPPGNLIIPNDTWVFDAYNECKNFFEFFQKQGFNAIPIQFSDNDIYRIQVQTSLIDQINDVFSVYEKIKDEYKKNFEKKIELVLNSKIMPILPENETEESNQGRNTLFELRLSSHFLNAGYDVEVPAEEHPDFRFFSNGSSYPVECKRIFSFFPTLRGFRRNIKKAIDQLVDNSLKSPNDYGVVAVNISRFFKLNDAKRLFVARTEEEANEKIKYDFLFFKSKTIEDFKKIKFPINIPLIIFEYSHIGLVNNQLRLINFSDFSNSRGPRNEETIFFSRTTTDLEKILSSGKIIIDSRKKGY